MTSTALDRILDALHSRGCTARGNGLNYSAQCPAHEDRSPSLSVRAIEGQVLVYCHAGCDTIDVVASLDLTMADLFDEKTGVTYQYTDAAGTPTRRVHRSPDKQFRQSGDRRLSQLYRLPRVIAAAAASDTIYLVEGEKDVHALESIGATATTAAMGGSNFGDVDVSPLRGARIIAVVDNDAVGHKWATKVADRLAEFTTGLTFVIAKEGKDAADHIAAGHGLDDFAPYEPNARREKRSVMATSVSGIKLRAAKWLYEKRMPTGSITLLAGREGIGKSTIAYDIAARVTHGTLPGQYEGRPAAVGVVATEDDWSAVIGPRLVAAGADLTMIYRIDAVEDEQIATVSMPADLNRLASLCLERGIALLLLDPVMSVIASELDTHKDRDVRQALDPLSRFASTANVAVLGLIHVNKSSTSDPLNSIMASRAFSAVARSVLYCVTDPDDEQENSYLFGHPKSNLGPKQPTLRYHLVEAKIELDDPEAEPWDDPVIVTSRVVWDGSDARSIGEVMERSQPDRMQGELATAIEDWILEQGRTVAAAEVNEQFSETSTSALRKTLSRLVDRGRITRPIHGHYASPAKSDTHSDTPSGDRLSVTTDTTVTMQDQSDSSDSSDTVTGVSLHVSQLPADWSLALYDRER